MSIVIVTPPATEPVSVAEAKVFLRVDQDAEDALIGSLIRTAREAVEAHTGCALIQRRLRERRRASEVDALGRIRLQFGPISQVHAVTLIPSAGAAVALAAADYALDGIDHPASVLLRTGAGSDAIDVEYTCGFGLLAADAPGSLRQAVLEIVRALRRAQRWRCRAGRARRARTRAACPLSATPHLAGSIHVQLS